MRATTRSMAAVAALSLLASACGGGGDTTEDTASDSGVEEEAGAGDDASGDEEQPADGEDAQDDATNGAAAGDLELVNEGALTVCSDIPYPPFEFEDQEAPSGYSGFDIDLMQEIADGLGLELEVLEVGFDGLQSGATLAAGQCDLAASAMTITEERAENLNFSEPYYDAAQSLIVLTDSDIESLEDVSGSLGVQTATTGADYAEEHAPEGVEIVEFESGPDLFTAMVAGQIEAGLQDLPVNLEQVQQDDRFEIVEQYETDEQYGFAAALDNQALIEAVNEQLAALREDGTYDEIYAEYFEVE